MLTYKLRSLKPNCDLKSYIVTKNNNFKLKMCRKFSVSDKKKDPYAIFLETTWLGNRSINPNVCLCVLCVCFFMFVCRFVCPPWCKFYWRQIGTSSQRHVTFDIWHMTCNIRQVICDTWNFTYYSVSDFFFSLYFF